MPMKFDHKMFISTKIHRENFWMSVAMVKFVYHGSQGRFQGDVVVDRALPVLLVPPKIYNRICNQSYHYNFGA